MNDLTSVNKTAIKARLEQVADQLGEPPVRSIHARPGCCERPVPGFEAYVPCNKKAEYVVMLKVPNEDRFESELVCSDCLVNPPSEYADAIEQVTAAQAPPSVSDLMLQEEDSEPDKLDKLRSLCTDLRAVEAEMEALQVRMEALAAERHALRVKAIPELMAECRVPFIGLAEEEGFPECTVVVEDHVSACISVEWEEYLRARAFRWLDEHQYGDLIKTSVVISFPREYRNKALQLIETLGDLVSGAIIEVKESVHASTLTSWLTELVKSKKPLPPLEVIGGHIERRAELKKPGKRKISTKRRK